MEVGAALTLDRLASAVHARLQAAQGSMSVPGTPLRHHLPFLTLDIHCATPIYAAHCRRALVNMPAEGAEGTRLKIMVADAQLHPALALPTWNEAAVGLGDIIERLESKALDGCYEQDFRNWQFMSVEAGIGLKLLDGAGAWPPWESAFPLRHFLHWAYAARGMRLLHAASLGTGAKGVLLAGAGGAGKSGTTLAGVLAGLQSVGDDYLALALDNGAARAFPVMKLMKQDADGLARLGLNPHDPIFGARNWQQKFEFDIEELVPGARMPEMAVSAILLPRITGEARSRLSPATPRELMFALMPNNLQQLPGRMKQGFDFIGRLSRSLPGYHLHLGSDPQEIAATIGNFMERNAR